jgi:hypothetical protein
MFVVIYMRKYIRLLSWRFFCQLASSPFCNVLKCYSLNYAVWLGKTEQLVLDLAVLM